MPIRALLEIHQIKENRTAYTLDTKVGELLKDSRAVQVFERYAPGRFEESHDWTGKRNDFEVPDRHAASQGAWHHRGDGFESTGGNQRKKVIRLIRPATSIQYHSKSTPSSKIFERHPWRSFPLFQYCVRGTILLAP